MVDNKYNFSIEHFCVCTSSDTQGEFDRTTVGVLSRHIIW